MDWRLRRNIAVMQATSRTRRALAIAVAGTLAHGLVRGQAAPPRPAWNADGLTLLTAQLRSSPHIRALLMDRGGSAFEHYGPGTTSATRLNIASVTKSVVAVLVGVAIARGLIESLDEPLAAFFPEHAQGPNAATLRRITLRHLLTLSPGFDHKGLDANTDYPDFLQRLYAPGLVAHALGRPLAQEPGSRFYYSNIDSHLVALALSRRVKVPLADFARDELFRPLGIGAFEWMTGQDGVPNGASELRLTAPDLLRIGRMMGDGGQWQGRQVVPRSFAQEAVSRRVEADIPPRGRKELWGYGYLWRTASTPGDDLPAFYAAGYGGQFIYVVPALDLVIVALTDQVSREVAGRTALIIRDFALPTAR